MAGETRSQGLRLPAVERGGGAMPGASLRIFRIGGIDVSVHVSWLLVFALVTWSLATGFFPQVLPGLDPSGYVLVGAVAALLLFVSVLIHELAHSFTARAKGLEARSIVLFIFGGVSNLGGEAKQPSTEFLVAVVGPLTSFAIALVTFLVGSASAPGSIVGAVAGYLTVINLLLGVFNLIPGFPLDGGRVFRSIVWNATGSLRRGTEIAVAVSRFIAYGFLVWGFIRLLGGDLIGGLWTAAIGWFLENAAGASMTQVVFDQRLRRVRVADVFRRDSTAAPPDLPVEQLIEDYLLHGNRRAVPVAEDGRVLGIVTLGDVRAVPSEQRSRTPVGDLIREQKCVVVQPGDSLRTAVEALGGGDFEQLPVVEDGRLAGVLTRADVIRQIELREALDVDPDPSRGQRLLRESGGSVAPR